MNRHPGVLLLLLASACAANSPAPAGAPVPVNPWPPPTPYPCPAPASGAASAAMSTPAGHADGKPDLDVVHRIKNEEFRRGKVMDNLFFLTDVNGPRLTGSPGFRSAADWAVRTLASWGATNPHLEPWGHFARAWSVQRFELSLVEDAPLQPRRLRARAGG